MSRVSNCKLAGTQELRGCVCIIPVRDARKLPEPIQGLVPFKANHPIDAGRIWLAIKKQVAEISSSQLINQIFFKDLAKISIGQAAQKSFDFVA